MHQLVEYRTEGLAVTSKDNHLTLMRINLSLLKVLTPEASLSSLA